MTLREAAEALREYLVEHDFAGDDGDIPDTIWVPFCDSLKEIRAAPAPVDLVQEAADYLERSNGGLKNDYRVAFDLIDKLAHSKNAHESKPDIVNEPPTGVCLFDIKDIPDKLEQIRIEIKDCIGSIRNAALSAQKPVEDKYLVAKKVINEYCSDPEVQNREALPFIYYGDLSAWLQQRKGEK